MWTKPHLHANLLRARCATARLLAMQHYRLEPESRALLRPNAHFTAQWFAWRPRRVVRRLVVRRVVTGTHDGGAGDDHPPEQREKRVECVISVHLAWISAHKHKPPRPIQRAAARHAATVCPACLLPRA